jgi:hypothetical protein
VKYLLAFGFLALLSANASAQTYQQTCQYVGSMRVCSTTDLVGPMATAAQMEQAKEQADLARDQAAAIRRQREQDGEAQLRMSDPYMHCIRHSPVAKTPGEAVAISARCQHKVETGKTEQPAPTTVGTATTDKLKANAATLKAIMRSAPPDTEAFRNAAQSLQATNEELAKRGELK